MPGLYMLLCGPNILLCILCLVFVSFRFVCLTIRAFSGHLGD